MTATGESCPRIRGRLAPSPTGHLHLGNAFAFLMAWLCVRQAGGTLVLRMEDIDPARSRQSFADAIMRDLEWLGLDWDEGPDRGGPYAPYTQSERRARYTDVLDDLLSRGLVYPCYCTRKELRMLASAPHIGDEGVPYPGTCRALSPAQRRAQEADGRTSCLRLDIAAALHAGMGRGKSLAAHAGQQASGKAAPRTGRSAGASPDLPLPAFTDMILGEQAFTSVQCGGDFALRRSDGVIAYQLAVTADDAGMGISQVVRGDDLLLSTPRQLLLFTLLGAQAPSYAHVPLLHDHEGMRLAKRHASLELAALRDAGVRPEAVLGLLGRLAGFLPAHADCVTAKELLPMCDMQRLRGRRLLLPPAVSDDLRRLS